MSQIKVSATIVTYNDGEICKKTIESILENTKGVDLTLYIVDNNSQDDTFELLTDTFGEKIVAVKNGDNLGFGHGHNTVSDMLDSDYHFIVNPDILFDRDVFTDIAEFFEANPDVGLVAPKVLTTDGEDIMHAKRDPTFLGLIAHHSLPKLLKAQSDHYVMADEDLTKPIDIEFAPGCFIAMRTSLFCQIGGFDERFFLYYEDMDITRRARQLMRAVYYPDTYVYHAWNRASSHNVKYFMILIEGMFKYFAKWGFRFAYYRGKDGKLK